MRVMMASIIFENFEQARTGYPGSILWAEVFIHFAQYLRVKSSCWWLNQKAKSQYELEKTSGTGQNGRSDPTWDPAALGSDHFGQHVEDPWRKRWPRDVPAKKRNARLRVGCGPLVDWVDLSRQRSPPNKSWNVVNCWKWYWIRIPGAICWFHAEGQDAGYDIIVKLDQIQKHMENTCQVRLLETGVWSNGGQLSQIRPSKIDDFSLDLGRYTKTWYPFDSLRHTYLVVSHAGYWKRWVPLHRSRCDTKVRCAQVRCRGDPYHCQLQKPSESGMARWC